MDIFKILTLLLGYTTVMGWVTAWYQYKLKEEWKENFHILKQKKLDKLKRSFAVGVGQEMVSKVMDTFDL